MKPAHSTLRTSANFALETYIDQRMKAIKLQFRVRELDGGKRTARLSLSDGNYLIRCSEHEFDNSLALEVFA